MFYIHDRTISQVDNCFKELKVKFDILTILVSIRQVYWTKLLRVLKIKQIEIVHYISITLLLLFLRDSFVHNMIFHQEVYKQA